MDKSDLLAHQAHKSQHYKDFKIEPLQYIEENGLGFHEGNIIKYVSRWRLKDGVEDLKKAKFYIERLIELATKEEGDKIMFEGPQRWLMLNTSPFPEMREIFTQQDRKIEDVQSIRLEGETVQVPSDSPWKSYARTGRDYFIVTFPDCVITFVRDDKGVRLV